MMSKFNLIYRTLSILKRENKTNTNGKIHSEQVLSPRKNINDIEVLDPKEILPSGEDVKINDFSFFISESKV